MRWNAHGRTGAGILWFGLMARLAWGRFKADAGAIAVIVLIFFAVSISGYAALAVQELRKCRETLEQGQKDAEQFYGRVYERMGYK